MNFSFKKAKELEKELPELLGKFNPFRILKMQDYEIRHSNVIAWLLDPKESHGLGAEILKKFIKVIKKDAQDGLPCIYRQLGNLKIKDLNKHGKGAVRIEREENHIDISIIIPSASMYFVIENKRSVASI